MVSPQSGSPTTGSSISYQNGYSNTSSHTIASKSQTTSWYPSYNASNGPISGPQNGGVQLSPNDDRDR
jgi:hypothetical protein